MLGQPSTFVHFPTEVQACQWTGKNELVIQAWLAPIPFYELAPEDREEPDQTGQLFVNANSVWVPVVTGEWILCDSLGAYPCQNDKFLANYRQKGPKAQW